MEKRKPRFSPESLQCLSTARNKVLASSREVGWTSLLVDYLWGQGDSDAYDKHVTTDIGIVLCMSGKYSLSVYKAGSWREAAQATRSFGLTQSGESNRLRWKSPSKEGFTTASIYLPHTLFLQAAEQFRKVGLPLQYESIAAQMLNPEVVWSTASSLLQAMKNGLPDLYAEQASLWLASHLASFGTGIGRLQGDSRSQGQISDRRLARVIEYMAVNFSRQLTITQLAREAGISPFHFTRLFRQAAEITPHAYLTRLRMSSAKHLLATTDKPISQIAAESGYVTPSAFAAAFTCYFGSAPTSYRPARGLSQNY